MNETNDSAAIQRLFLPFGNPVFPVRNRFIRSATWSGLCADKDGAMTQAAFARNAEAAAGGAGTVISECAYITRPGRIAPRQWGIDTDRAVGEIRMLADAVHECGSKLVVQIGHGGVLSVPDAGDNTPRLSPSGIPIGDGAECVQMTEADIKEIISLFAQAAERVKKGGADGVQIHGGHGYLLTQFLSPVYNKRTDSYGGTAQNRRRLLREICSAVRAAVGPAFSVWLKISIIEGTDAGYNADEGTDAAFEAIESGVNVIEVSSGAAYSDPQHMPSVIGVSAGESEAPSADYALRLRSRAPKDVFVALTGGLRSLQVTAALMLGGYADLFGLSRPFIAEPDLINRWAEEDSRPSACFSCNACFKTAAAGGITCPIMRDKHEGDWDPL